jgi:hypothetical protein
MAVVIKLVLVLVILLQWECATLVVPCVMVHAVTHAKTVLKTKLKTVQKTRIIPLLTLSAIMDVKMNVWAVVITNAHKDAV